TAEVREVVQQPRENRSPLDLEHRLRRRRGEAAEVGAGAGRQHDRRQRAAVACMALIDARRRWLAQITTLAFRARNSAVGVRQYLVGTSTTGARLPHASRNAKISAGLDSLLWI